MLKISRLETPFQEILFLLTIVFSVSITVGGFLYLGLSHESFINATGSVGSTLIQWGFDGFGWAYFFFIVLFLHMGHLALVTSHNLQDLMRNYKIYLRNISIYLTVLLFISSFLSVLEDYNDWQASEYFVHGYGGWFGDLIGGFLFTSFGIYGAMVVLFSLISVIGISAGYMEIVHSFYLMKDIGRECFKNIKEHGPKLLKNLYNRITRFINPKPGYIDAIKSHVSKASNPNSIDLRGIHKGIHPIHHKGRLTTDHFHLPRFFSSNHQETDSKKSNEMKPLQAKKETVAETSELEELEAVTLTNDPGVEPTMKKDDSEVVKKAAPSSSKSSSKKTSRKKPVEPPPEESVQEDLDLEVSEEEVEQEEVIIGSWTKRYKKMEISLLEKAEKRKKKPEQEIKELCERITERLESFGIKGKVLKAYQGVTLTMFEFQPAAGMKISKIQSLTDDLALVLGAKAIRILAPIPGKTTVGIEVPNQEPDILRFSEVVSSCMTKKTMALPVPLGIDVYDKVHINDLAKMPHMLVSGTTGSGKSVFMNSLISGLVFHKSPKDLRFLMIDPKMIELSPYNGIPHLLKPVIIDLKEAKDTLLWAEKEMDKRYKVFADMQSRNITSFNQAVKKGSKRAIEGRLGSKIQWKFEEMPYIVIVIDELADLMLTHRNEVEKPITRIAQKARAAGIHMVMATQRPSSDIVTGLIKTNFPTRVSFKVSSGIDSRTILDQLGAEKLLGNGDMLFVAQGKAIERLQGSFMTEEEVRKVVRSAAAQGKTTKRKAA